MYGKEPDDVPDTKMRIRIEYQDVIQTIPKYFLFPEVADESYVCIRDLGLLLCSHR